MKAFTLRQPGDRASALISFTDPRYGFNMLAQVRQIELRPEGKQTLLIYQDTRLQEPLFATEDDDSYIYKFLPLYAGNDPQDGIVK